MAAKVFNDTTTDHKWSTDANWSGGDELKAGAADAVTINAAVTSLIIDTNSYCISFDATGTAGITISGAAHFSVFGSFTLDANCTWTQTGYITAGGTGTFNSAGKSLGTIGLMRVVDPSTVTLGSNLNLGTKGLAVYRNSGAGPVLDTSANHYQIDCGLFGDAALAGAVTLILHSSVINCTNVAFTAATLTVTTTDHTINIAHAAHVHDNFGGASWGIVNLNLTPTAAVIYNIDGAAATFVQFNVNLLAERTDCQLTLAHDITTGSATFTGKDSTNKLIFNSSVHETPRTLTDSAGTNVFTNVRIHDMTAAGGAVWQALLTDGNVDDGGNTGWTWAAGGLSIPVAMHHHKMMRAA